MALPTSLSSLRFLITEMIKRIEEEPCDDRVGDIDGLIKEAGLLAQKLGFAEGPILKTVYSRDPEPEYEWFHAWQEPLAGGGLIRLQHPEFLYVFGYRFSDPLGCGRKAAFNVSALAERDEPGKTRTYDPWKGRSLAEVRAAGIRMLHRWLRVIEAREQAGSGATAVPVDGMPVRELKPQRELDASRGNGGAPELSSAVDPPERCAFTILQELAKAPTLLYLADLAERTRLARKTVGDKVNWLVQRGFARRGENGRGVAITEDGRRFIEPHSGVWTRV